MTTTPAHAVDDECAVLLRMIRRTIGTRHWHLAEDRNRRERAELPPVVLAVDECRQFSAVTALTHTVKESRS